MPEPLSEVRVLERIVDDAIAEVGATSMRDLGRVMAGDARQIAGRADGSAVSHPSARSWHSAPSGNTCPLLARYHAARCGVLGRTRSLDYECSLRPCIAWCSATQKLDGIT